MHLGIALISAVSSGGTGAFVTLAPAATNYQTGHGPIGITITVGGTTVTKYRWKEDNGSWTTVNALSGTHNLYITTTLYVDALNSAGAVLASGNHTDEFVGGGGGGGGV